MEYETCATFYPYQLCNGESIPPIRPKGKGWRLIAAVRTDDTFTQGVIWYWERPVPTKKAPKVR